MFVRMAGINTEPIKSFTSGKRMVSEANLEYSDRMQDPNPQAHTDRVR
jgi:hypothetical protein